MQTDPDCLDALRDLPACAADKLSTFTSQGLANTVWAVATMGITTPDLMGAFAREAGPRVGEFKPQELSNMAWAYARSDAADAALFQQIGDEARRPERRPSSTRVAADLHRPRPSTRKASRPSTGPRRSGRT